MANRSPTLEGFRTMFRMPSLGLAEVAWRWSFGAATAALLAFGFVEYLDSLPVSAGDLLLLESNRRALISRAISDIPHGSGPRLAESVILSVCLLAISWVVLASLGRAVTTRALLTHFRQAITDQTVQSAYPSAFRFRSLLGINFLRVMITIAALVGSIVPWFFARVTSSSESNSLGGSVLAFLFVITLVWLAWYVLNWMLSLAALFVVADNCATFSAIATAVDFSCTRIGSVLAVSTWFGFAHLVTLLFAASAIMVPLSLLAVLPPGYGLIGVLLVLLGYFLIADFLHIGRLAAYLAILKNPGSSITVEPAPIFPDAGHGVSPNRVDPNELILSDVPSPA
jgi:hypothetical protein